MKKKFRKYFESESESENIFQIQLNYRTIIILESLGTYVPIPSSSSSKVFNAPVFLSDFLLMKKSSASFLWIHTMCVATCNGMILFPTNHAYY